PALLMRVPPSASGARRSRCPSPGGTPDNSPPFQPWVFGPNRIESRRDERIPAPLPRQLPKYLPSLRDLEIFQTRLPSVETLGYLDRKRGVMWKPGCSWACRPPRADARV